MRAQPQRLGDVHAAIVDPAAALDEYLRMRMRVPRLAAVSRIFAAVVETVPGVRDTAMMGKVVFESTRSRWDLVVVDAPPIGQVSSFLEAPTTISRLVPGGTVREQSEWMRSVVADPVHTGAIVLATPEDLPVLEARTLAAEVAANGTIAIQALVANKVLPEADFAATTTGDPTGDAASLHLALAAQQHEHLHQLAADHAIPFLFGMRTESETAERLADFWENR